MIKTEPSEKGYFPMKLLRYSLTFIAFLLTLIMIMGSAPAHAAGNAKYIILFVSDGWGKNHLEAVNQYCANEGGCDSSPAYQATVQDNYYNTWTEHWLSTYPDTATGPGSYNSTQAWSNFDYVKVINEGGSGAVTDSSAAGSALSSGHLTEDRRVNVDASTVFQTLSEIAQSKSMAVGAVTTVPVSHATPATWFAHNNDRGNNHKRYICIFS